MAVSPNRRFIAIAERISDRPSVTIFDLHSGKRRKTLQTDLIKSNEIVSLLFSSDAKYLLTQGGAPDYMLIYWSWEKGKPMANIEVKSVATGSPTQASVTQVRSFKRVSDEDFRFVFRSRTIHRTTHKFVPLVMEFSKCFVTRNQH